MNGMVHTNHPVYEEPPRAVDLAVPPKKMSPSVCI